ncbi:hypothetical protein PENTCL1PPCAC_12429, partial [Pristionchus entomophagus]
LQKMRSKQVQNIVAAVALFLSLLMIYSAFKGWSTRSAPVTARSTSAATTAAAAADQFPMINTSSLGQPYYVYPKARTNTSVAVTIVIVVTVGTKMEAFATAMNSIECYAALHGYTVSVEYDNKFTECEVHEDKFFRRHCHTHKLMQNQIKEDDWALFIDGDVGVVNPKRLIDEYLEDGYEIYLFDRFYNWEYAALSYLVKNNARGRGWVEEFSKFEFKLPESFHGTDNGALHPFLMNYLVPETRDPKTRSRTAALCLSLWNRSKGFDDLFGMQACTRMVIGEREHFPEHKVKIYQKGNGWAHDLWIFHSHWATDDFMMHSLKEENFVQFPSDEAGQKHCRDSLLNLVGNGACHVVFPVLKKLNVEKCKAGTEGWLMEGRLQIDNETRKKVYDKMAYRILKQQMELVGKTAAKIQDV